MPAPPPPPLSVGEKKRRDALLAAFIGFHKFLKHGCDEVYFLNDWGGRRGLFEKNKNKTKVKTANNNSD